MTNNVKHFFKWISTHMTVALLLREPRTKGFNSFMDFWEGVRGQKGGLGVEKY
jgi:hypothetical protein